MTILLIVVASLALQLLYYWHVPFIIRWGIINKFCLKPRSAVFITTITGYIIGNLYINLKWEHKNILLGYLENPTPLLVQTSTMEGANTAFWLYLGWLPSLIYALLWLWFMRYLRK